MKNVFLKILITIFVSTTISLADNISENIEISSTDSDFILPDIVARYNGKVVTKADIESFIRLTYRFDIDGVLNENMVKQIVTEYITYLELSSLAKSIELDKDPIIVDKIRFMNMLLLVDTYFSYIFEHDNELKKKAESYYISTNESPNLRTYKIIQIPFDTNQEAIETLNLLFKNNLSFSEGLSLLLEKKNLSRDDISQLREDVIPAANLEYSGVSDLSEGEVLPYPIEIDNKYYVLLLEEIESAKYPGFNELSDEDRAYHISNYYYDVFLPEFKINMNVEFDSSFNN